MSLVLVGNPGSRRVELLQAALAAAGQRPAIVVAWADLLAGRTHLAEVVREGDIVRLESPGKDFEVERAILAAGAGQIDQEDPSGQQYDRLSPADVARLEFDKGRILCLRQWYLGFCAALREIAGQLAEAAPHTLLNDPDEIAAMFDKRRCHARLQEAGVAVPAALGPIGDFDELMAKMHETGWRRVFVKPAHGSSASGVVAFQTDGRARQQATTTVEMVWQGGELRLYNSRQIRTLREPREISRLIDALCRHRLHVEQWLPKAGIDGRTFDLRVVVLKGRARHVVARLSRSPMTNLHLLNERGEPQAVRRIAGEAAWSAALAECERAMTCFPASFNGGVDLLMAAGFRRHAVLEVNAFGDLLPGVLCDGRGTYDDQIAALLHGEPFDSRSAEVVA